MPVCYSRSCSRSKARGSHLNSENLREHGHLTFRFADVEPLHVKSLNRPTLSDPNIIASAVTDAKQRPGFPIVEDLQAVAKAMA